MQHSVLPAASNQQRQQPADANVVASPQQSAGSPEQQARRRTSADQAAAGGMWQASPRMLDAADDAADRLVAAALQAAGAAPAADTAAAAGLGTGAAALLQVLAVSDIADSVSAIACAAKNPMAADTMAAGAMAAPDGIVQTMSAAGAYLNMPGVNAVAGAAPQGLQPAKAEASEWQQKAPPAEAAEFEPPLSRPTAAVRDVDGGLASIDGQPAVDAQLLPAGADATWTTQPVTHSAEPEAAGRRHSATLAPPVPSAADTDDAASAWQSAAAVLPANPTGLPADNLAAGTWQSAALTGPGPGHIMAPDDDQVPAAASLSPRLPGEPSAACLAGQADSVGSQLSDRLTSPPPGEAAAHPDRRGSRQTAQQPAMRPSGDVAAMPDRRRTSQAAVQPSPAAGAQPGSTPAVQQLPEADDSAGSNSQQLVYLQQQASPAAAAGLSSTAAAESPAMSDPALQQSDDLPAATAHADWSSYDAVSVDRLPSTHGSSGRSSSVCSSNDGSVGSTCDRPDASDCGAVKLPSLEWLLLDAASCGEAANMPPMPPAGDAIPLALTEDMAAAMPAGVDPAARAEAKPASTQGVDASAAAPVSPETGADLQPEALQASSQDSHASTALAQTPRAAQAAAQPAAAEALVETPGAAMPPTADMPSTSSRQIPLLQHDVASAPHLPGANSAPSPDTGVPAYFFCL